MDEIEILQLKDRDWWYLKMGKSIVPRKFFDYEEAQRWAPYYARKLKERYAVLS